MANLTLLGNLTFEHEDHEDHDSLEHAEEAFRQIWVICGSIRMTLASIGLIANLIQMAFCIIRKQYRTKFDVSVISLSIADTISSVILVLKGLAEILYKDYFHHAMNEALSFSITTSISHTIFIAAQRLLAVVFPLKIRLIFGKGRFYALLAFTWITCGVYGITVHFITEDNLAIVSKVIFVSGLTLIVLYAGISCVASHRDKRLQNASQVHNKRRNTTILLHSFLVTLSFVVCFFPIAIGHLFLDVSLAEGIVTDFMLTFNPLIDSMVYFYVMYFKRRQTSSSVLAKYSKGTVNTSYATEETEHADQTVIAAEQANIKPYIIGQ